MEDGCSRWPQNGLKGTVTGNVLQAQSVSGGVRVTVNGTSPSDVIAIAQEVFRANFERLGQEAYDLADKRAAELVAGFVRRIEKDVCALAALKEPGMQYDLYIAQREYARHGRQDLYEILVGLLVDRCATEDATLERAVLSEAIATVSKLTPAGIAALAVSRLVTNTLSGNVSDFSALKEWIEVDVPPLLNLLPIDDAEFGYLEYASCVKVIGYKYQQSATGHIGSMLLQHYNGLFQRGLHRHQIPRALVRYVDDPCLFGRSWRDPAKIQLSVFNSDGLAAHVDKFLSQDDATLYADLLYSSENRPTPAEIESWLRERRPNWGRLFEKWTRTDLCRISLTNIGVAIADADLSLPSHAVRSVAKIAKMD